MRAPRSDKGKKRARKGQSLPPQPAASAPPPPSPPLPANYAPTTTDEDATDDDGQAAEPEDVQPEVWAGAKPTWQDIDYPPAEGDMRDWRPPPSLHWQTRAKIGPWNFALRETDPTPGRIFKCLLPDSILSSLAAASTAFSHARRKNPYTYSTEDVRNWILVNMMMGIVILPEVDMYWRGPLAQPAVIAIFPNNRKWRALCVDLHAVDTSVVPPAQQAQKNKQDSFWKLGDFLPVMSEIFSKHRLPTKDLTIDEFTIPFKGRHRARCFNPNKPEKYHLKGFSYPLLHTHPHPAWAPTIW